MSRSREVWEKRITLEREEAYRRMRLAAQRRYRLMSFDRALAPWRATIAEAHQDAVGLRVASRDGREVYLSVPAWIRHSQVTAETEAGLAKRAVRELAEVEETRLRLASANWNEPGQDVDIDAMRSSAHSSRMSRR